MLITDVNREWKNETEVIFLFSAINHLIKRIKTLPKQRIMDTTPNFLAKEQIFYDIGRYFRLFNKDHINHCNI